MNSAAIGRALQLVGLILLPLGLMAGLAADNIRLDLTLLMIGGFSFLAGWILTRDRTSK